MSISWAYLYEHPGTDPVADRTVLERAGQRTILVPVASSAEAPKVAAALSEEGAQLIELCGGFTLEAAAAVRAAVPERVAIGHVTFSAESTRAATAFGDSTSA